MQIAILGPTASGKSLLAAALAARVGGTVINGDPFQSLHGLAIGTGQPGAAERAKAPHLGYGALPPSTLLNPAAFGQQVREWMGECDTPFLVTGSGLYLRGIWQQMDELPEVDPEITDRVRGWQGALGPRVLHRYLGAVDPVRAADLHPNDGSRVQRALALHLGTGRRPSELLRGVPRGVPDPWRALLVLPSREHQRDRVAGRVRAMVAQGWPGEVRSLIESGHAEDLRRLRPLGYLDWMEGGDPKAIESRIVRDTQAYAKRQVTWFRNQLPEVATWDPDQEDLDAAMGKLGI